MGILKAVIASVESTFGNQWKELFYCDALPDTTLIARGQKYVSGCAENTNGNTIRDGSIICCADGQCALVIENGKIIETFETPGEHIFYNESAPTIFGKSGIKGVMKDIWNRVGFGGDAPPVSQRVYYLNTRECHLMRAGVRFALWMKNEDWMWIVPSAAAVCFPIKSRSLFSFIKISVGMWFMTIPVPN